MRISPIIHALAYPIDTVIAQNSKTNKIITTVLITLSYLTVIGAIIGGGARIFLAGRVKPLSPGIKNEADRTQNAFKNVNNRKKLATFQEAAEDGDMETARSLIKEQVDINAVDKKSGYTPLHAAVLNDHTELVKLLISNGAKLDVKDYYDFTPLHIAVKHGNEEIVKALIKAKADVNVQCLSEETALHMAVQKGNEEIVKALINANADLNRQAIDGKTPLDISLLLIDQSKQSTIRIVNTLTRAGAKESTDIKS